MVKKSISDNIIEYERDANIRKTRETLEQIRINQELEQARKSGNEDTEKALLRLQSISQKQANAHATLDALWSLCSLLFIGFFGYIILKLIFGW